MPTTPRRRPPRRRRHRGTSSLLDVPPPLGRAASRGAHRRAPRACAASAAARRATLIRCGPTRRSCGRTLRSLITLRSASCCCCVVVVTRTFGVALRKLVVLEGCLDMKECSIYPPRPAPPRLARKTGSTLAPQVRWPTTAEQALSYLLAAHRPAPVCSRVANSLIVVQSGSSPFCTSLTATRERRQRAKNAEQQLTAPKPACCHAMLVVNAAVRADAHAHSARVLQFAGRRTALPAVRGRRPPPPRT